MKNLLIVLVIGLFTVLGCGYELTKKETPASQPTPRVAETVAAESNQTGSDTSALDQDDEKAALEKKVAELEKQKLEEKISKLEKEIEAEKRKPVTAKPKAREEKVVVKRGYARVHSPGDGWLALRSGPRVGTRLLAKIPHGTTVRIGNCTARVRSGRLMWRHRPVV